MKAIVSEKGQITIPKVLRESLGLKTGTKLEFSEEEGRLVARKVLESDVFQRWRGRGRLPVGQNVDDYLKRSRDADENSA